MAYLVSEPYSKNTLARFIAISLTVMVAITVVRLKPKSRFYEFSIFQKIGSSSYEMYLIHQGIGIPLCIYLFSKWPASPFLGFLATLIAIGLLFLFARTVQIKLTTPINEFLRRKTIS
jgi:peptidoglycan/LPS O-acetylase OafA/YrhL